MIKNILFLTWKDIKHPNRGGAEKVIYEYAKGLIKKGYNVTWFGYEFDGCLEEEIIDGIKVIRKFNLYNSYFLFPKYYKKNFAGKYDLIIDEAGGLPFLSPKFEKNIPIIFFAHHIGDKEWDFAYPFPISNIGKRIYYWMFKQYKNINTIAVSNSTKQELIDNFGFKNNNIKVIENALDLTPIEKVDYSKKQNSILFLGRLMPMKRVEDSIKAFYNFYKKDNSYNLNIVGAPQNEKYVLGLKKLVLKLGLEEKVNFVGYSKEIFKKYLSISKVMLVPSYKEGFGLIVYEGNSYGLPVIGYDVAGLRDSIKDGINGYKVEDGNYNKMGEKLYDLLSEETFYKEVSEKSLNYVRNLDSWEDKVGEFEKFILNN